MSSKPFFLRKMKKYKSKQKTHSVMLFLTTAPSPSFSRSADIFLMTWRNDMLMILMMVKTMLMYISYVSLCSSKINNNKNVNVYILCLSLSSIRYKCMESTMIDIKSHHQKNKKGNKSEILENWKLLLKALYTCIWFLFL